MVVTDYGGGGGRMLCAMVIGHLGEGEGCDDGLGAGEWRKPSITDWRRESATVVFSFRNSQREGRWLSVREDISKRSAAIVFLVLEIAGEKVIGSVPERRSAERSFRLVSMREGCSKKRGRSCFVVGCRRV